MKSLREKTENVMKGRRKADTFSFASFLFIISIFYNIVIRIRIAGYKIGILQTKRLPCKVISIGNITIGGTGKTPLTIYLAEFLKKKGYNVTVISRGYRGKAEKKGGIVSDGKTVFLGPQEAGDEAFMMANQLKKNKIPVIVGQNRYKAGILAVDKFKPSIIVLDDAFQHLRLFRDIDLLLLDGNGPFGNQYLLPRGILREPISSLSRSNAFILTRTNIASGSTKSFTGINKYISFRPIYRTTHTLYIHKVVEGYKDKTCIDVSKKLSFDINILKGKRVFAFSGIAKNDDFKRSIEKISCNIRGFVGYPDHHSYSDTDLSDLLQSAMAKNVDFILTTEKDYVRIARKIEWPIKLVVIGIKISFGKDENSFKTFISGRLKGI